jgi:hypothetical protein
MTNQLEVAITEHAEDVFASAGKEIVQTDYFVPFAKQPLAKVRPDKSRPAGDKYSHRIQYSLIYKCSSL